MHSAGWAPPKEAGLVNLIELETDAGKTVAVASFIGDECFGPARIQRERQPGESRRTRRKAPPVDAAPLPAVAAPERDKFYAEAAERMREWGHAEHARKTAEVQRQAEEEAEQGPSTMHPPVEAARTRPAGMPLAISGLTSETLVLLELGEPLTYVYAAE